MEAVEAVEALEAAVVGLAAEDVEGLDDALLAGQVVAGERLLGRLQAQLARRIAELDRRQLPARQGAVSTAAWLRHRTGCGLGAAHARVRTARRLQRLPATAAGLHAGAFGWDAATTIAAVMTGPRQPYAADGERILARAAAQVDAGALRGLVRRWATAADDDAADAHARYQDRAAWWSPTLDGTGMLRAVTDAEGAALLATALDAAARAGRRPGDGLTARQRCHDALLTLARSYLDRGDGATVAGSRPRVQVHVDLPTLLATTTACADGDGTGVDGAGVLGAGTAELDWGGVICAATARRLACDATVVRVVTAGASQPLDVGRSTEVVPIGLRRAVAFRDRCCVFDGCDRPPRMCDVHHVRHWADGGPTAVTNLALLCRHHHRLVHEGRWQLTPNTEPNPGDTRWVTTPPGHHPPTSSTSDGSLPTEATCDHIPLRTATETTRTTAAADTTGASGPSAPILASEPHATYRTGAPRGPAGRTQAPAASRDPPAEAA